MPQVCIMCKMLKDESEFNQIKRSNEVKLAKSCREWNLKKSEEKRRALESTHQHLWIREDGSKITDLWDIVDDHKDHACDKCRKEKSVKEFVTYGSKYNLKLSKVCRVCNDYRRLENERRKRGEFTEEWYWNGHLIRRYRLQGRFWKNYGRHQIIGFMTIWYKKITAPEHLKNDHKIWKNFLRKPINKHD